MIAYGAGWDDDARVEHVFRCVIIHVNTYMCICICMHHIIYIHIIYTNVCMQKVRNGMMMHVECLSSGVVIRVYTYVCVYMHAICNTDTCIMCIHTCMYAYSTSGMMMRVKYLSSDVS